MPPRPQGATVTVRAGDTLSSIAARNGTSVAALARANGIRNPNLVRLGMRLTIPGAGGGAGAAGGGGTYRVRPGDTLGGIAARHGTTVAALARANGIRNPSLIRIGMRLTVPAGGSGSAPAPAAAGGTHRVRPGETLGGIAARYGTSVSALAALNGIGDPSRIVAGRLLRVPAGTRAGPAGARPPGWPTSSRGTRRATAWIRRWRGPSPGRRAAGARARAPAWAPSA